ncbi:hypothetical protein TWF281_004894 [Arthrobotrys megalospora]
MGLLLFCIFAHNALGLIISVVPRGKDATNIPNQRLCKPNLTKDWQQKAVLAGKDPWLQVIDPRARPCPDGAPWFDWELAPRPQTNAGETLIQLTGGAADSAIGGVTNDIDPEKKLFYGILKPGSIFRSEFRVKRNGVYQKLDPNAPDDLIKVGDFLEFWGPSTSEYRQLFLKLQFPIPNGLYELVRKPTEDSRFGAQPPVQLQVVSLGFTEIAEPYGEHETENIQDDVELIDINTAAEQELELALERDALENKKPRDRYCKIGRICTAAGRVLGRLLTGRLKRKQGPTIEIPPLNMDDGPVDGSTDPLSSHRRFRADSRPISRETSAFSPRADDNVFLGDELFEPRVKVSRLSQNSIFKPTRLQPGDMEQILEQFQENEDFSNLYTLGGGMNTAPANDISSDGIDEAIPDELPVLMPGLSGIGSYPELDTPQFRSDELAVDQPVQESDIEEGLPQTQGDDTQPAMPGTNLPRQIPPPYNQFRDVSTPEQRLAVERHTEYVKCLQALAADDYPLLELIDRGRGIYSVIDFYEAVEEGKPFPPCPRNRQDILNLAIAQGYKDDVAPDATGANPQSGVGFRDKDVRGGI